MESKARITLALVATLAIAGCAQPDGDAPPGGDDDGATSGDAQYTLTTSGVPDSAGLNESFTFTLNVQGPAGASDHIGAHYGLTASDAPSTTSYDRACNHQAGNLPGTFQVSCSIPLPGTWHLRGHVRTGTEGNYSHFWGPDETITVGPSGDGGGVTTITVGTDAAFPPFETRNTTSGEFEGFDIDVMNEIGRRAGFTVEFQHLGFDPLIPALQNGQIDAAISAMSIKPEREEQVDFSIPYYEANQSVLVRAADGRTWTSLDEMKADDPAVGVQATTVGDGIATGNFTTVNRYDSYPLAVAALKNQDVDAVIMDAPAQREQSDADSSVEVLFEFNVGDVYGIAVQKGNAALLTRINAALASMIADGTMAQLKEKWGV